MSVKLLFLPPHILVKLGKRVSVSKSFDSFRALTEAWSCCRFEQCKCHKNNEDWWGWDSTSASHVFAALSCCYADMLCWSISINKHSLTRVKLLQCGESFWLDSRRCRRMSHCQGAKSELQRQLFLHLRLCSTSRNWQNTPIWLLQQTTNWLKRRPQFCDFMTGHRCTPALLFSKYKNNRYRNLQKKEYT